MTQEKEPIAKAPRTRITRTPVGQRNVLTVHGKEEGYVYRVVNDRGDRIPQFEDAGYEIVEASKIRVGDKRVNRVAPSGSKAEVSVGSGDKGFVMRIKKEWYDEDQAKKEAYNKRVEQTTKEDALKNADFGTFDLSRK